MKRILVVIVCAIFILGNVGCSATNKSKTNDNKVSESTNFKNAQKSNEKEMNKIDSMEKELKKENFKIKDKITMAADLIGAKNGTKFETDKGDIEIYEFDKTSKEFQKVKDTKKVNLQDFGEFDVVINDNYVMLKNDLSSNIIEMFKKL